MFPYQKLSSTYCKLLKVNSIIKYGKDTLKKIFCCDSFFRPKLKIWDSSFDGPKSIYRKSLLIIIIC